MAKPRTRTSTQPVGVPQPRRTGPIIASGIIGLIVILVAVALLIAQPWKSDKSTNSADNVIENRSVTATGTPLPVEPDTSKAEKDTAIGMTAPNLSGETFTGEAVNITPGKPKVVMFFAHWCPHCQKEVPVISQWLKDNSTKYAVEYYAVSTGANPRQTNYPPSAWFIREKFPIKVMADSSQSAAASAYGLRSYPYLVFLDKNNKVVDRVSNELTPAQITDYVKRIAPAS